MLNPTDFDQFVAELDLRQRAQVDEGQRTADVARPSRTANSRVKLCLPTLVKYLTTIEAAGGGSRKSAFERFKGNRGAMALVEQLEEIGFKMDRKTLTKYIKDIKKEAQQNPGFESQLTEWDFSNPAPQFIQATQIAQQSSNFTSGNPGSSTSASNRGKSINFSKGSNTANWPLSSITGSASHYGAMPSQQAPQIAQQSSNFTSGNPGSSTSASNRGKSTNFSKAPGSSSHHQAPPTDDTFVQSHAGIDSTNWFGGNSQNDEGSLQSMVNPKKPSSWKNAWGAVSNLFGASPQEPQFLPPMHDTSAASSYYSTNDQTLQSMITPRNQKGFYGTPYLPNQSQSTGRTGASNFSSSTPKSSNFNSGNPGSSSHYGGAIPFQQAPMSGTLFPAFSNQPSNQSAPLNPSTNSVSSQPGTPSLDWSGGNSQNNDGSLYSVVNTRRPSSSIGLKMDIKTLADYLRRIEEEAQQNPAGFGATDHLPNQSQEWDFSKPAPPFIQAPQIAQQSSNFTSGNPGSLTSALKRGKSIDFSKKNSDNWPLSSITGALSHYAAMPSQQVPPMHGTFVQSQAGTDSTIFFGGNSQNNEGTLESMVNPKNPSSWKNAWGAVSNLFGASPQEPQFSPPSMHDTSAASSYYPSNQPDDQTLQSMITPRNQKVCVIPTWNAFFGL
uniref:Uncharacterized protein n=1 Tax=Globodera rostochiensis TaxID=31243 RepID=A0A914I2D2_GLORO